MSKLKTVAQLEQCAEKISQCGVVGKIDGVSASVLLVKIAKDMQQQFDSLQKMFDKNFEQFNKIADLEKTIEKNNREIADLIEKLNSQGKETREPSAYDDMIIESLRCLGINCEIYTDGSILHAHIKDNYCENFNLKFDVRIKDSVEIQHSIVSAVCDAREDYLIFDDNTTLESNKK